MALSRDARFALRQLRKTPGFTVTIVLTLALGIGATTLVFSLVEGILLRPLPFRDPSRLVMLGDHLREGANISVTAREIPLYPTAATAFSSMAGYIPSAYELSGGENPENIQAARVSASTFPTLGVEPLIGRTFTPQEENSSEPLAVISYSLWTTRFHRDPHVVGSTITLDRRNYTVIGVMPRSFEFPVNPGRLNQTQLWVPLSLTPDELSDNAAGVWSFLMIARLKDNVSLAQAAADTNRVAQQVMRTFPQNMAAIRIRGDVTPLLETVVGDSRTLLRTLFVSVSVVLLIVCVNVAVMLLVRAIRRRREYAVRLALGARVSGVLRQSACEGLVLSLAGGTLGLGLAAVLLPVIVKELPDTLPRLTAIAIDPRVAVFALLLAFATGIISSLAPAFAALRTNLLESLKQSSPTGSHGSSHEWLRSALVVSEIAVALMLLTASGALLRSYQKMLAVNPGFRPQQVLLAAYQLPPNFYGSNQVVENFDRTLLERLSSQPGTIATTISNSVPASNGFPLATYTVDGTSDSAWKLEFAQFTLTYGDYFRTLAIPLLEGRTFTPQDRDGAPLVVIVNQRFAKRWWPGQSPIGKRLHIGNPHKGLPWATVVGLVADVRNGSRDEPAGEQMYLPEMQPALLRAGISTAPLTYPSGGFIAVRSALPPDQLTNTLRSVVAGIDPRLALTSVESLSDALVDVEAPRRFNASLITTFAIGALLLAMIGIYAVVAFSVSIRDQEIAIRMAIGAQRQNIARLVLAWGARMALIGCALGTAGSAALSRLLRSQLFEVSATDPGIYAVCAAFMLLLALIACLLPALRAATADPIRSLRSV
ncbi:MAG TPA: ABC transporter permease [Candidatus Koribacter sp.]|jgi:putative ABC transport system permease protein